MTREEVREAFEEAGRRISERTDYHLLVGEAEGYPSLSLLAREEVIGADDPAFEIVDRERNLGRPRHGRVTHFRTPLGGNTGFQTEQ